MFCLFVIYVPIPSKPASAIASSNYGYFQLPSPRILGFLPVSRRATLCWKLLRARSIFGVSTHVSAPNNSTACVTALKNFPNTFGSAPSHLLRLSIFISILLHLCLLSSLCSSICCVEHIKYTSLLCSSILVESTFLLPFSILVDFRASLRECICHT